MEMDDNIVYFNTFKMFDSVTMQLVVLGLFLKLLTMETARLVTQSLSVQGYCYITFLFRSISSFSIQWNQNVSVCLVTSAIFPPASLIFLPLAETV